MSKHDWENDKNFLELLEHIRSGRPFTKDDLKESKPKKTKKVVIKSCYKPFKANNYELVKNFNAKNDEELEGFVKSTLKKKFKYEHEELLDCDTEYVMSMLKYEELKENKAVGLLINAVLEKMAERQYKIINVSSHCITLNTSDDYFGERIEYYDFNLKDLLTSYVCHALIKLLAKRIKNRFHLTYKMKIVATGYGNYSYWIGKNFMLDGNSPSGMYYDRTFTTDCENIIEEIHNIRREYFCVLGDDRPGKYGEIMVNTVSIGFSALSGYVNMEFDGEIDDGKVSW